MVDPDRGLSLTIARVVQRLQGSSLHSQLERQARVSLHKPEIKLESLKEDIKEFLKTSGWEKKLQNAVYSELNMFPSLCHPAAPPEHVKEPLAYMRKAQGSWEKRILKSLNSMCTELSIPLAQKRPVSEQKELLNKWNEMGTDEPDLSLFRPVYAPKDFLEKEDFSELGLNIGQLGIDDSAQVPPEFFENDHVRVGQKVLAEQDSAAAQQYVRQGCPTALRAALWALILNVSNQPEDILYYEQLKSNVIQHDLLVDSLIYKDVKLTASNDDYYFVFEDYLYQMKQDYSEGPYKMSYQCSEQEEVSHILPLSSFAIKRTIKSCGTQRKLRISFKWMVRAFSGYLATDQLLLLWDRILGYNSLEILAVLAAAVFAFRAVNLMEVTSLAAAEVRISFS
ncbi:hypothetical protein WISP_23882 [Willisornis vidua]|uniref:TBC1 domain family member 19 n=1 Tax=Willisornis vidua TaxID=1566151 RepID=A0ABQ9DMH1_9PASS|nr:hypothetical protein WISP_23882 [Willisornis vidua]